MSAEVDEITRYVQEGEPVLVRLRFCYAKEDAGLEEACRRLGRLRV